MEDTTSRNRGLAEPEINMIWIIQERIHFPLLWAVKSISREFKRYLELDRLSG